MPMLAGIVFDAYGTLLDVASVTAACEDRFPGQGAELARLWRARQLEYSWLRSLMGRYTDFQQVTADALSYACAALGLPATAAQQAELLGGYLTLEPFPEAPAALERLARYRRLVLSNGTPAMLQAALGHAGLLPHLDAVLSVDAVSIYKPAPQVYALACARLGCAPDEVLFISSNGWDIAGAATFGLRTCWVNRGGTPADALGVAPGVIVGSLTEVADLVNAM